MCCRFRKSNYKISLHVLHLVAKVNSELVKYIFLMCQENSLTNLGGSEEIADEQGTSATSEEMRR